MSDDLNDRLDNEASPIDPDAIEEALEKAGDDKPREVNMSCRRSGHLKDGRAGASNSDDDLLAPKCESNRATVISDVMPNVSNSMYRCVDCGYTWAVTIGGHFPY